MASLLEAEGRIGRVILIDGSPAMFKELLKQQIPEAESEAFLQTLVLCALMQLYIPLEIVMKHKVFYEVYYRVVFSYYNTIKFQMDIYNCKTLEERVAMAMSHAPAVS